MRTVLMFAVFMAISTLPSSSAEGNIVCYHGTWSTYRSGKGKFNVSNINPNLCTHLIYSFIGLNEDGTVKLLDPYLDIDRKNIQNFNALKKKNTKLKTLVAIGGWNEGSTKYSAVVADDAKRTKFVQSALQFVLTYGFDGFDIDWEYPGQRGGSAQDKVNYVSLIREMRAAFDQHGLLLTAAVPAAGSSVDISYNVPELSKYLDMINVMTYDLHGAWDKVTGHNAPLYASSLDVTSAQRQLNVKACIDGWLSRGADPHKLNLGLALYGRTFTLSNANNNGLGAPISGPGTPGTFTKEAGYLAYHEVVVHEHEGGWTYVWDKQQQVPHIYKGNQWIGYDDPKSIALKVEYAKSMKLGGVMVWSLESDDFLGISGTKYALLSTAKQVMEGSANSSSITTTTTTARPSTHDESHSSTTEPPHDPSTEAPASDKCPRMGFVRDSKRCDVFYFCQKKGDPLDRYRLQCADGLYFDERCNCCNWADAVPC